jgi:hypothetical protein
MKLLPTAAFAILVACVTTLSSCNSILPYRMGPIPAKIPPLASPKEVRRKMGEPEWVEAVHKAGSPIRTIWHYEDYWWTEEKRTNKWASWNVYFDANDQFIGWKLVDPPIQEDRARGAMYHSDGSVDPNPSYHRHYVPTGE